VAAEPDDAIAAELDFHAAVASHAPSLVRPVGRGRQDRVAPDQGGDAPVATAAPRILGVPGIVAATIFAFTVSWAAFLYPAAFIFSPAEMVVTESTEQPDVEKALAEIAPLPLPTHTTRTGRRRRSSRAAHDLSFTAAVTAARSIGRAERHHRRGHMSSSLASTPSARAQGAPWARAQGEPYEEIVAA